MLDSIVIPGLSLLAMLCVVALIMLRSERDATTLLTFFIIALFGINARYVVTGLGGVGTPAILLGLASAWWWWMARLAPQLGMDRQLSPVRVAVLAYLWYVLLSWALAHLRPLTELEANGAGRAAITAIALTAIALVAADGISTRERLDRLLQRLVAAGVFLSVVGIVQFFTRFDIGTMLVQFPGLSPNRHIVFVGERSIFNRPFGTALHPIEYGVVLAMVLPLTIHFALHARDRAERQRYTIASAIVAAGIPMSVSRSGVLAVASALVILSLAWTWRQRVTGVIVAIGFTGAMWSVVPGLIGTLRNLFTKAESDPSVTARIDRIPLVVDQVSQAPWLGIGHGTFSPEEYFLLDNQYYVTLIETGVVGVAVHLGLLITAMVCARWVRRRTADAESQHLSQALLASVAIVIVVMGTFDAFAFRIFSGLLFLLMGCIGALWRLNVLEGLPPRVGATAGANLLADKRPA